MVEEEENVIKKNEPIIELIDNSIILFFLVNPKSGAQEGKHLLNLNKEYIELKNVIKNKTIIAHIFNITSKESYAKGKQILRDLIAASKMLIIFRNKNQIYNWRRRWECPVNNRRSDTGKF